MMKNGQKFQDQACDASFALILPFAVSGDLFVDQCLRFPRHLTKWEDLVALLDFCCSGVR